MYLKIQVNCRPHVHVYHWFKSLCNQRLQGRNYLIWCSNKFQNGHVCVYIYIYIYILAVFTLNRWTQMTAVNVQQSLIQKIHVWTVSRPKTSQEVSQKTHLNQVSIIISRSWWRHRNIIDEHVSLIVYWFSVIICLFDDIYKEYCNSFQKLMVLRNLKKMAGLWWGRAKEDDKNTLLVLDLGLLISNMHKLVVG